MSRPQKANGKAGSLPARPPPSALVSAKAFERADKVLNALRVVEANRNRRSSVTADTSAKLGKANGQPAPHQPSRRGSSTSQRTAGSNAENVASIVLPDCPSPDPGPSLPAGDMLLSPPPVQAGPSPLAPMDTPPVHGANTDEAAQSSPTMPTCSLGATRGSSSSSRLVSPGVQDAIERAMAAADGAVVRALQQSISLRAGGGRGTIGDGQDTGETVRSRPVVSPELWARAQGCTSTTGSAIPPFASWPTGEGGHGHVGSAPGVGVGVARSCVASPLSPTAEDVSRSPYIRPHAPTTGRSSGSARWVPSAYPQQGEAEAHRQARLTTLQEGVSSLRAEHASLRAHVSALLCSTQQALDGLGGQVQGQVQALARTCKQAQDQGHVLTVQHSAAVEAAHAAQEECDSLRAQVRELRAEVAKQQEGARALRDSVAYAVGCVRVLVRVRPLLHPVDLREGSHIPLMLRWYVDRHCAHMRAVGGHAGVQGIDAGMKELARCVGWQGDVNALCSALHIDPATCAGTLSPPQSEHGMDISPALLDLGLSAHGWHGRVACPGEVQLPALWQGREDLASKLCREGSVYSYDRVWGPQQGQAAVWGEVQPALAAWVGRGRCVTVLAYGPSGSGKSYTMLGTEAEPGLIPQALDYVQQAVQSGGQGEGGGGRNAHLSILEVAGERVVDLLKAEGGVGGRQLVSLPASIPDPAGPGISFLAVTPAMADMAGPGGLTCTVRSAVGRRMTESTRVNPSSSRGHVLVRILLHGKASAHPLSSVDGGYQSLPLLAPRAAAAGGTGQGQAWLHLVDLAGCENVRDSGVAGSTLSQTRTVHSDLSALTRVLSSLRSGAAHTPCRDSRLTTVLQQALCTPAAQTVLIATASMTPFHREQTRACLATAALMAGTPVLPMASAAHREAVREALGRLLQ